MAQRVLLDTRFMQRGACVGKRDVMFPPNNIKGRNRADAYREATKTCDGCPVYAECLEWALMDDAPITGGVVAGLNPSELAEARKAYARARRDNYAPKCGTEAGLVWHAQRGETCFRCSDAHARKNARYGEEVA